MPSGMGHSGKGASDGMGILGALVYGGGSTDGGRVFAKARRANSGIPCDSGGDSVYHSCHNGLKGESDGISVVYGSGRGCYLLYSSNTSGEMHQRR